MLSRWFRRLTPVPVVLITVFLMALPASPVIADPLDTAVFSPVHWIEQLWVDLWEGLSFGHSPCEGTALVLDPSCDAAVNDLSGPSGEGDSEGEGGPGFDPHG